MLLEEQESHHLTIVSNDELKEIAGGKHHIHWGRCALQVGLGVGGGAVSGSPIGAIIGGIKGALSSDCRK
ncbi:hypothetical protein FEZ41_14100 [Lentilactobacillus parafarraginis]|jgi:hypothetical protein|uniref:Bacteriocin n=1 Tax=Lentilactobacillus parafarraginis TaxID=390842 RepID=A0A5R9CGV7_9LACO|nr:Blp family class II bacteriocin [Lentilactobacillus parafarraginis]TLQ14588.1 hypothetical protein FEZ41_14100 [Lentilactobacillus parafarraginis]